MNKTPFQCFIDLVVFDQNLYKKEQEIIAIETGIEELEDKIQEYQATITSYQHALHDARKLVDQKELEMKILDDKMKDIQTRFSNARNNKEYIALKHELDDAQKQQTESEQAVLSAWNTLETIQRTQKYQTETLEREQQAITEKIKEEWQRVDQLEVLYAEEKKQRALLEKNVPQEWQERYSRMRNAVDDPITTVDGTSCKACYQAISHQDMVALGRNALLQCKGCFRFLYLDHNMSDATESVGH